MTIRTTNNTSIRLLNNQYCFADQHISNTIRVQSRWNYSDIHVCVRSIFNFDFSLALAVLFSSYLETISFWSHLYHELWTTRYIYIYPSPFSTRKSHNPSQAFLIFSISNAIPRNTRWTSGCKVKHEKSSYARGRIWFTTQTLQLQF